MTDIWALIDHRPGTANQVLGAAYRTGYNVVEKQLDYNRFAQLPNPFLLPYGLLGIRKTNRARLVAPWPDLVISAGRRAAPVALYIKKQKSSVRLVHFMDPGMAYHHFDLLFLPNHDQVKPHPNVRTTFGAPHHLNDGMLFEARARLPLNPDLYPKPWTLLSLGGKTPHGTFTLDDIERMFAQASSLMRQTGTLFMTSSRRTPPALLIAAERWMVEHHPVVKLVTYSPVQQGDNPYHAWLAQVDKIMVTADSISMMCEAAFTGKPTYLFPPPQAMSDKHWRFVREFVQADYARMLEDYDPLWTAGLKLDEAGRVAREIKAMMKGEIR